MCWKHNYQRQLINTVSMQQWEGTVFLPVTGTIHDSQIVNYKQRHFYNKLYKNLTCRTQLISSTWELLQANFYLHWAEMRWSPRRHTLANALKLLHFFKRCNYFTKLCNLRLISTCHLAPIATTLLHNHYSTTGKLLSASQYSTENRLNTN